MNRERQPRTTYGNIDRSAIVAEPLKSDKRRRQFRREAFHAHFGQSSEDDQAQGIIVVSRVDVHAGRNLSGGPRCRFALSFRRPTLLRTDLETNLANKRWGCGRCASLKRPGNPPFMTRGPRLTRAFRWRRRRRPQLVTIPQQQTAQGSLQLPCESVRKKMEDGTANADHRKRGVGSLVTLSEVSLLAACCDSRSTHISRVWPPKQ